MMIASLCFSCSKDGGDSGSSSSILGGSNPLSEAEVIKEEVRVLKEELILTDHQLEKEELSELLEDGLLAVEEQAELIALVGDKADEAQTEGGDHE